MRYVTDRLRNPFGMSPPCDSYVPGYGETDADFHVIGDHPGVHGGRETGIPFTGKPWSWTFFEALLEAGLVETIDPESWEVTVVDTFFSYLHACDPGDGSPNDSSYTALEPFFDAELRAITAHVLLPVGARATAHVLAEYTARNAELARDMAAIHGTEIRGSGWLVVPIRDPATWDEGDAERLVAGLAELRRTDFRQISDLGRFLAGEESYYVR